MRLDELPKGARIEDRRGVTVARGGIGIGTIVVLGLIGWASGIDPRLLIGGAKDCSNIAHGRTRSATELIFSAYNYEVDRTTIL
jgi:hypothetical protein